jgi:hypothetical protein
MYRVVWGWERPHLYGVGGGRDLEFFHLERWMAMEPYVDEEEWADQEALSLRTYGDRYVPEPYPRHGEYMLVRTCMWGVPGADGKRRGVFRWPDSPASADGDLRWFEAALVVDRIRLARTRYDVQAQVREDQEFMKQREREEYHRVEDEFGIRELVEDQAATLIRNPTLRKDPSFFLSPATRYKRTRHRLPVM